MKKIFLFMIFPLFIFFGCNSNELDIDVSDVDAPELKIMRLEEELFSIDRANFEKRSTQIKKGYGNFYEHYLMSFICTQGTNDTAYKNKLLSFIYDKDVREAYHYTKTLYPEAKLKAIGDGLSDVVKRFKYHFPQKKLPLKFITCTAGWNYAFAYTDSALSVSLDMYLGDTAKFYNMLRYPQYLTRRMNAVHILPDIARGWLLTEFDKAIPENNLLSHTIFYGKLYYGVKALLPETNDSLIIGYSAIQMKYCREFEKKLWGYFTEKNRLYESGLTTVRELTSEGPFTGAISRDCPPRIAMWVGWQIVKSYMEKNKNVSLDQLMNERDSQEILNKSRYRP